MAFRRPRRPAVAARVAAPARLHRGRDADAADAARRRGRAAVRHPRQRLSTPTCSCGSRRSSTSSVASSAGSSGSSRSTGTSATRVPTPPTRRSSRCSRRTRRTATTTPSRLSPASSSRSAARAVHESLQFTVADGTERDLSGMWPQVTLFGSLSEALGEEISPVTPIEQAARAARPGGPRLGSHRRRRQGRGGAVRAPRDPDSRPADVRPRLPGRHVAAGARRTAATRVWSRSGTSTSTASSRAPATPSSSTRSCSAQRLVEQSALRCRGRRRGDAARRGLPAGAGVRHAAARRDGHGRRPAPHGAHRPRHPRDDPLPAGASRTRHERPGRDPAGAARAGRRGDPGAGRPLRLRPPPAVQGDRHPLRGRPGVPGSPRAGGARSSAAARCTSSGRTSPRCARSWWRPERCRPRCRLGAARRAAGAGAARSGSSGCSA